MSLLADSASVGCGRNIYIGISSEIVQVRAITVKSCIPSASDYGERLGMRERLNEGAWWEYEKVMSKEVCETRGECGAIRAPGYIVCNHAHK
jgi:hypothetical protein